MCPTFCRSLSPGILEPSWSISQSSPKVRAVVVAAIKAAPNQLGNPLADSLGAGGVAWIQLGVRRGLLQALDYAQIHYAAWLCSFDPPPVATQTSNQHRNRSQPGLGRPRILCTCAMANWSDLLQSRDLNATLPAVLQHLDLELRSPTPLGPLAQAIAAAVKRPGGALLGLSTLLAALELQFPKEVEAPLLSEAVVKGVVGCTGSPLVAALAVRCLCSLVVASQKHQGSKEERMEKQSWMRKAIPQIKEALEAHPKSFQVQQAVAEGCCALLMDGGNFGGHMASLWHTLWPLLVHPKPSVAQPAGLALCRMTWLARNEEVPTAEKAMEQACTELYQVHQQLASPGAALQCRRLAPWPKMLVEMSLRWSSCKCCCSTAAAAQPSLRVGSARRRRHWPCFPWRSSWAWWIAS